MRRSTSSVDRAEVLEWDTVTLSIGQKAQGVSQTTNRSQRPTTMLAHPALELRLITDEIGELVLNVFWPRSREIRCRAPIGQLLVYCALLPL